MRIQGAPRRKNQAGRESRPVAESLRVSSREKILCSPKRERVLVGSEQVSLGTGGK